MLSKYVIKFKSLIKNKIISTKVCQRATLSPFSYIKLIHNSKWYTCTHTQLFQIICPTFIQNKDLCK